MSRSVVTLLLAGVLCASCLVTTGAASAAPAPAQSTKILPPMEHIAGAVDSAGGSLVAGVVAELTPATDGLYVYHRDPRGRWSGRTAVPLSDPGDAPEISDVTVAAGSDGFYVIAWVQLEGNEGTDGAAVHVATRLPSGKITTPKELFPTQYLTPLRLSTNANGDATLTQSEPTTAARYVRTVGWTTFAVPHEAGEEEAPGGGGAHKSAGVAMMSAARTVDITYAYRLDGVVHVIEQTRPYGATSFTRRDLYTAPDTASSGYGIAMDPDGLQTLAIGDADDAIKVYGESERRGPLVYQWRKAKNRVSDQAAPNVDSAGRFTRVTWRQHEPADRAVGWTRLYNGWSWRPSASGTRDVGSYGQLAIGRDGRGIDTGFVVNGSSVTVIRGELEPAGRVDRLLTSTAERDVPVSDVGATSVSQVVVFAKVTVSGKLVPRTVVYVRR